MHDKGRALPKFLLMENVSNILSKKHAGNFNEWKNFLAGFGYVNQVYTLDASNFGNPQRRVRTYMLSVLCNSKGRRRLAENYFTEHNLQEREPLPFCPLQQYLRTDYSVRDYRREADISNPNDTESRRKIYADNEIIFDGKKAVTTTVNTLTTKQDRNPTSGLLEYPEHLEGKSEYRNLTPRECFLLMGFDEDDFIRLAANNFDIRKGKQLYSREKYEKLAGNSIVVDVLVSIFKQVTELKDLIWKDSYVPVGDKKRSYHKRVYQKKGNGK